MRKYFSGNVSTVATFQRLAETLFFALEGAETDFAKINDLTATINVKVKPGLADIQPQSAGPFSAIFSRLNSSLSAARDALASTGIRDAVHMQDAIAASLTGANYAFQEMECAYNFVMSLFELRAYIGDYEDTIYQFGSSPLDSRPLGTEPTKARERAFGRMVNYCAGVLRNIAAADIDNDSNTLLAFSNAYGDFRIAPLWLSPIAINQLWRLSEDIGEKCGRTLHDAFFRNLKLKPLLPMLLERCSWHNSTYDRLRYVLTAGETDASNILDYCRLQAYPTDVDLTYEAVLDDLKYLDKIDQMIAFDLTKFSTLDATTAFDKKTDALYDLKAALAEKFPMRYRKGERYNFRDSFERLDTAYTIASASGRQGQLVFDQLLDQNKNRLSQSQNSLFYFLYCTAVWDNASNIADSVLSGAKLWYHVWSKPNTVVQIDYAEFFAKLYQNRGYEGGIYEYVGIGPESFPVMGSLLVQSDYVRAYAPQWFTSILMSMQNTSQNTSNP